MKREKVNNSISKLDKWITKNGYSGWDPYDIKGTKLYSYFFYSHKLRHKLYKRGIDIISEIFPLLSRYILNFKKQVNPKALGLLLSSNINMYLATTENMYLNKAVDIATYLEGHYCDSYEGYSWGYPFNWNSVIFIPKNTPSAIVSVTVGEGFYDLYLITKNNKYLEICDGICKFITEELNIYKKDSKSICFSYSPIDSFQVHNINLLTANYLIKVGKLLNIKMYYDLGEKAANFSIKEQNNNGSIFYWSTEQNSNNPYHLDLYHSGFEIRALFEIWGNTKDEKYLIAYRKYLTFFLENYFDDNNIKRLPNKVYPVDIHACAEAINCLSVVYKNEGNNPHVKEKLNFALEYTINKMQTSKGWFVYRKYKFITVRIPYFRWGQAWMMKALSEYLKISKLYHFSK